MEQLEARRAHNPKAGGSSPSPANNIANMIFLFLSVLFFAYFIALQIASHSNFFDTISSFSMVWLFLAAICFVLFIFRKKHLWKNSRRKTKVAVLSVFGLGIIICAANLIFICNPRIADGTEDCKYVIMLGGGITKKATLPDSVKRRVAFTAGYLKKHPEAIVVVTGGKSKFDPCAESDILKPALCAYGIEESRILAENQAKDTIQNFKFSAQLLAKNAEMSVQQILESPITVITSDFHIARAERLAKRMGFTNICGAPSSTPVLFVPNSYGREICAYIKLNLRILLTRKPNRQTIAD